MTAWIGRLLGTGWGRVRCLMLAGGIFGVLALAVAAGAVEGSAAAQDSRTQLEKANALFSEQSWQLALEQYEALSGQTLERGTRREVLYKTGLSLGKLGRRPDAVKVFQALIEEKPDDVWTGRAHWQLQPGLGEGGWYDPSPDERNDPLYHLRRAERILSPLALPDLKDFYGEVVYKMVGHFALVERKDRDYLFGYFGKLWPLLNHPEEFARTMVHRAKSRQWLEPKDFNEEEMLGELRGAVQEFPETEAARKAQLDIARHFLNRQDLVLALAEYRKAADRWPGTDEGKEAAEHAGRITQSEVTFKLGKAYRPGEPITFLISARNVGGVRLDAIPFSPVDVLRSQKRQQFDLEQITGSPVHTKTVDLERRDDYQATTASVTLDLDRRGAYVLRAQAGTARAFDLLLISDLTLVANSAAHNLELWAVSADSGKPRSGVSLEVASELQHRTDLLGRPQDHPTFETFRKFSTDGDGFANVARTDQSSQYFAVARDGDNYAFLDSLHWYPAHRQGGEFLTYLYTDRPVYRPKDTVNWRALMRQQDKGEHRIPDAGEWKVQIRDPRGDTLAVPDARYVLNEFGALSGEVTLPDQAPLGVYHVQITDGSGRHFGGGTFRVEEYKKPEFDVTVTTTDRLFRLGSKVRAQAEARYLFGSPVAEAQVEYTVRREPTWFLLPTMHRGGDRDMGWFEMPESGSPPRPGGQGEIVATGNGTTSADGEFEFEFQADAPVGEANRPGGRGGWWPQFIDAYNFKIEVKVTDQSRRSIDGIQQVVVSRQALKAGVQPRRHLYAPGDLVTADLRVNNLNGDPVATSGTLYVELVRWDPTGETEKITTLTTQRVEIPERMGEVAWHVPEDAVGMLRFLLEVPDPFGGKVYDYGNFMVADERTQDVFVRTSGVEIIADRDIYEVGDTARVLILTEYPGAYAWYWIDAGAGNLEKKVVHLGNRATWMEFPVTGGFVPNVKLHTVVVQNNTVHQSEKEVIVPPTRSVLTVTVQPDQDTYKPGAEGVMEIVAQDWEGKPVRAEFSLAMFDRSITYIAPDTREDIRRAFYGQRRELRSGISLSAQSPARYGTQVPEPWGGVLNWTFSEGRSSGSASHYFSDALAGTVSSGDVYRTKNGAPPPRSMMALESRAAGGALAAAPMPASAMPRQEAADDSLGVMEEPMAAAALRIDFRDSMFWSPTVITDVDGRARVPVKYPDSLTSWKAVAVGTTGATLVGNATTETVVRKNLMIRPQGPRFFRERDRVTLSGVVNNYLDQEEQVQVSLRADGLRLADDSEATRTIRVPTNGEARVDWTVHVDTPGTAVLRMDALTRVESDAVERSFPVLPHGIDKYVAWNGTSEDGATTGATIEKNGDDVTVRQMITVPAERIRESASLTITVDPSLASTLREAIPYLVEFPYGCVEQTMSRFMPAAVVAKTFEDLNIPRDPALESKLAEVMTAGMKRLAVLQNGDGGWGWWKDDSDGYISAYVAYGLTLSREAGVDIDPSMLSRALQRLRENVDQYDRKLDSGSGSYWRSNNLHALAYQLFVLSLHGETQGEALEHLYTKRDDLTPQGLAMLARTLWRSGRQDDARLVLRNMYNHAVITPENNTARWGRLREAWYWWHDAVDSTAHGLMAYLEIQPDDPMVQASMKWLVLNRQGRQWKSSKDTAHAILALSAYMKHRQEALREMEIEIELPGADVRRLRLDPDNFWSFDGKITLTGEEIPDGEFPVIIRKRGRGTLFYTIAAEYFTLEEGIKAAGNEIYVERVYAKVVRKTAAAGSGLAVEETFEIIRDGDRLLSGDELRVTLKIKSLNDYEFLMFEDPKPAGMEPVELQSGGRSGSGVFSHMELRDQLVAFFIRHMPQGNHEISYRVRAEVPGEFHTMPTTGSAMYFPPLRTNSDELVVEVVDGP